MSTEIEKKWLLWENDVNYTEGFFQAGYPLVILKKDVLANGDQIRQGYLKPEEGALVAKEAGLEVDFNPDETRLRQKGILYFLTVKSAGNLERSELETKVTQDFFEKHWPKTEGKRVEKKRLVINYLKHKLEVDVFLDRDLILAEMEFRNPKEAMDIEPLGKDVTTDYKYKNKNLAK